VSAASIAALLTAAASFVTALGAFWHSVTTRKAAVAQANSMARAAAWAPRQAPPSGATKQ
jgi:hypothetical protein